MPSIVDIIQSVQIPQLIKDGHISKGTPLLDGRGRLIHFTGGFAVVFPFMVDGDKWAFRCWSADIGNVEKRLHILSKELAHLQLPYFCDFSYEPIGLVVNGQSYPTTRMKWIDGYTIKDYLCKYRNDSDRIKKLAEDFGKMCKTLHDHQIAHGDLQHGNILVDNVGRLFLIDYDSVYLPALKGESDIISGLPDYQHPERKNNKEASEKLDYFSELIIYLSICAIAENPSLVNKYQVEDADRMLFSKEDYADLKHSQIYQDISALGEDYIDMLDVLEEYLQKQDINELKPFNEVLQEKKIIFKSSATKAIRNKQNIAIDWNIQYEANLKLNLIKASKSFEVQRSGQYNCTLSDDEVFVLEVTSVNGIAVKKSLSVNVFDECVIEFTADKYYVLPTIPVTLSWDVKNAKKAWLDNEGVNISGKKVIEPQKAITCVLSAEDEFGLKEKRIDIQMLPLPIIKSIMAPTPNFVNNLAVTIQQPRYNVDVKFPQIDIGWIKAEVPKVKSLTEEGLFRKLSPPLPEVKFCLMSSIKRVFNHIIRK